MLAIVIGISGVIAPGGGAALGASTTLTILDGEVLVSRAGGPFEIAQDGAVLGRGDAIRTASARTPSRRSASPKRRPSRQSPSAG